MQVLSQPYFGYTLKHPHRLVQRLKKGADVKHVYVITMASGADLLEIYESGVLRQTYYKENFERPVVGLASDYEEALEVVMQILEECLKSKGDCRLKEFLLERETGRCGM